jgi:hypothetical protein
MFFYAIFTCFVPRTIVFNMETYFSTLVVCSMISPEVAAINRSTHAIRAIRERRRKEFSC